MSPSLRRQWNTWDGQHPASVVHLPTGLTVRLTAFSAKEGRYHRLQSGSDVKLHEHTSDGDYIRLVATVAGSVVELELGKDADPHSVVGRVHVRSTDEWALRFWLCLEIGHVDVRHGPGPVAVDPPRVTIERGADPYVDTPLVTVRHRSTWHAVTVDSRPTFVGGYADPDDLREELEGNGYYSPHREPADPGWAVLRFNGQANESFAFAVGAGHDRDEAIEHSRRVLDGVDGVLDAAAEAAGRGSEAFRAVRDVVSWNTVWDVENGRAMTVLTRNWLGPKFGGWGVWLDDVLFHALLAAHVGDFETAQANLDAALTTAAPAGNLPCLRTAYEEWVDRSQPPIAGYVLSRIHALSGDDAMLERHLPVVLRAHDWWFEARDGNGDGLLEFGSSPTGTGAFVHSKQAALDEAAMDNLPVFDEAEFDSATHTLDMAEPALNSLLALEAEALSGMLRRMGRPAEAQRVEQRGRRLAERVGAQLWDAERGVFAARRWDGSFAKSLAPTSFYPWLCGAADQDQTEGLRALLTDEDKFWGARVLPASTFDDPATADEVYWRGRTWPPLIFWTWEGLRRAGQDDLAAEVLRRSWSMFMDGWRDRRCMENFHHTDPALDESPDSDSFYGWGALLPLMVLMSGAEHSTVGGRTFAPAGEPVELHEPGARWWAEREGVDLRVWRNDVPVVSACHAGSIAVELSDQLRQVEVRRVKGPVTVRFIGVSADTVRATWVDGASVRGVSDAGDWVVELPDAARRVDVWMDSSLEEHRC